MATQPPNVVLICADQWRGDCLSIAGHPVVHTPYLDQMALDGARFSRAYTAVPSCIAARAGLLTGLTPRTHGRVGYQDGVPWDYATTLAGEFTRHGFQTKAVGKMHVFPERSQMGFQDVVLHDGYLHFTRDRKFDLALVDDYLPWLWQHAGYGADYFEDGLNCNSIVARPWDKPEYLHPTNYVVTQSIEFLRRRDLRKPFFLFMSFHRPHPPYDPPAWAFEQYLNREMPPPPVGDWVELFAEWEDSFRPDCPRGRVDPHALQRARAGYYGHVTHIDHQINRFLEVVDEYSELQNTYFCFTSDHGELLGDHYLFRKSLPYEGSARVPLLLKGPRGCGIQAGSLLAQPVELRDIMPTLLECAGLPVPASVEGRSFLPLAHGRPHEWRQYLQGEHIYRGQSVQYVTDGHMKYVWFSGSGREQLFDLDSDPAELHDLAGLPSSAERLADFRRALIEELTGREEGFTDGARLIPGRPVAAILKTVLKA